MRFVQIARHDDANLELWVVPSHLFRNQRFSVLIPSNSTTNDTFEAALLLATYVRLLGYTEIFVERHSLRSACNRFRAMARRVDRYVPIARRGAHVEVVYEEMAPSAEVVAEKLLKQLDPALHLLMSRGLAFYFSTSSHSYIWYPRDRAIVSLDEDAPHYVCVHSKDHTVEQNQYDWAITMRTYLLGDETHWRQKANFHSEYHLRGGKDAYAQRSSD